MKRTKEHQTISGIVSTLTKSSHEVFSYKEGTPTDNNNVEVTVSDGSTKGVVILERFSNEEVEFISSSLRKWREKTALQEGLI